MALHDFVEEVQVLGRDLVEKVKSLIHEGNVQRIIVKDEHGNTFIEIPVTVAVVGTCACASSRRSGRDFSIGIEIQGCGSTSRKSASSATGKAGTRREVYLVCSHD